MGSLIFGLFETPGDVLRHLPVNEGQRLTYFRFDKSDWESPRSQKGVEEETYRLNLGKSVRSLHWRGLFYRQYWDRSYLVRVETLVIEKVSSRTGWFLDYS